MCLTEIYRDDDGQIGQYVVDDSHRFTINRIIRFILTAAGDLEYLFVFVYVLREERRIFSTFIPVIKHFFRRHAAQTCLVRVVISHSSPKTQTTFFSLFSA